MDQTWWKSQFSRKLKLARGACNHKAKSAACKMTCGSLEYPKMVFNNDAMKTHSFCIDSHWHMTMIVLSKLVNPGCLKNHVLNFLTQGNATTTPTPLLPYLNPHRPLGLSGITCCLLSTNVPFCPKLKHGAHATHNSSLAWSHFNLIHCKLQCALHCGKTHIVILSRFSSSADLRTGQIYRRTQSP